MRIHPIQTGTVAVKENQRAGKGPGPVRLLGTLTDRRFTDPLPITAWLIEHPDGLIVVDTGETARVMEPGYFPGWNPYFKRSVRMAVRPEDEIGPQLRARGFDPDDVRHVVITHLHTDHAGGLRHFPASEVRVSRDELALATGRLAKVYGYLPHHWPEWLKPTPVDFDGPAFGPFPASSALAEGVTLLPTQGHTPGHLSVAVRNGDGLTLLAGDTSYTEALMHAGAVDGVTSQPRVYRETLGRLQALVRSEPVVYLPTHDPDSASRLSAATRE